MLGVPHTSLPASSRPTRGQGRGEHAGGDLVVVEEVHGGSKLGRTCAAGRGPTGHEWNAEVREG